MFCNPLEVQDIEVSQAVKIDSSHMIVVYKQMKDGSVARRIVQGPTVFVPEAEEWWVLTVKPTLMTSQDSDTETSIFKCNSSKRSLRLLKMAKFS